MRTGVHVQMRVSGVASCPAATISERLEVESIHADGSTTATGASSAR
jgi:hypothetical protein